MPVGDGYVFVSASSGSLMYKTLDVTTDAVLLTTSSEFENVLFTDNNYVYFSSSTSIKRISVLESERELQNIVTMDAIISGQCGYDGQNIYFYAQLQEKPEDNTDENYYMYRTDKLGNYQLIGKTK